MRFKHVKLIVGALSITSVLSISAQAAHFGNSVYLSNYPGVTWNEAKEFCEAHGGHLITISSKEENEFVSKMCNPGQGYWIGALDDRGFSWVTGESASFTEPYEAGEPSAAAKYVAINSDGYWTNLLDRELLYICEWDVNYPEKSGDEITVRVNGKELADAQPPMIINDSTFVPLRAIVERIGLWVEWHPEDKSIELIDHKYGYGWAMFKIGETAYQTGGGTGYAPAAPFIINDTTMVPLRLIGQMYGEVLWDDASRTADIFSVY